MCLLYLDAMYFLLVINKHSQHSFLFLGPITIISDNRAGSQFAIFQYCEYWWSSEFYSSFLLSQLQVWQYGAEIFPTQVRNIGVSIFSCFSFFTIFYHFLQFFSASSPFFTIFLSSAPPPLSPVWEAYQLLSLAANWLEPSLSFLHLAPFLSWLSWLLIFWKTGPPVLSCHFLHF